MPIDDVVDNSNDEVIEYVRDVNILLQLDTYQGMSDAEIQSVIDYLCSVEYERGKNDAIFDDIVKTNEIIAENNRINVAYTVNMMNELLHATVPFLLVTGDEVN